MAAAGGAAGAGEAWLPAMAFARLITTAVSTVICCVSSAFDGALPTIVALGMHDCLVLGGMVGNLLSEDVRGLAWLTCLF